MFFFFSFFFFGRGITNSVIDVFRSNEVSATTFCFEHSILWPVWRRIKLDKFDSDVGNWRLHKNNVFPIKWVIAIRYALHAMVRGSDMALPISQSPLTLFKCAQTQNVINASYTHPPTTIATTSWFFFFWISIFHFIKFF